MNSDSNILNLIAKIGKKEASVKKQEFISPIFNNREVVLRIDGLIKKLAVKEVDPGWYKLQPQNLKTARILGPADLMEVDQYLKALKKIRMLLVYQEDNVYYALPFKNNSLGIDVSQLVPIYLVDQNMVADFDVINARFDGANFWYHEIDISNDPSRTDYLRECSDNHSTPKSIRFSGLTLEQKLAYTLRYEIQEKKIKDEKKRIEKERAKEKDYSLRQSVEHAGGKFVKFKERSDHFSVTYIVDEQQYTSYVSKDNNHQVYTAGICLSGHDRDYDLKSLIGVLREGQNRGLIYRFDNTH